jgi:hypothetical protein
VASELEARLAPILAKLAAILPNLAGVLAELGARELHELADEEPAAVDEPGSVPPAQGRELAGDGSAPGRRPTLEGEIAALVAELAPVIGAPDLPPIASRLDAALATLAPELGRDRVVHGGDADAIARRARLLQLREEALEPLEIPAVVAELAALVAEIAPVFGAFGAIAVVLREGGRG